MQFKDRLFTVLCVFAGVLVIGCASTETSSDNNNVNNVNENTNTNTNTNTNGDGNCRDWCTGSNQVCVGPDDEHQTCADKCEDNTCPSPYTCCYGGCVNTKSDVNNCGSCWNACSDGASCINGLCVDACNNMCTDSQECCGGICTDIMNDAGNCGSCGNVCNTTGPEPTSSGCTNGFCTCGGSAECTGEKVCCGASCKNLDTDPTNCGSCGNQCAQGETCKQGVCECSPGVQCGANEACCSGSCYNTQTDDNNCGGCGITCQNGNTCNNGTCNCNGDVCSGGMFPGQDPICCGDGCVVYNTDLGDPDLISGIQNCGSCGNHCGPMVMCLMGACSSE